MANELVLIVEDNEQNLKLARDLLQIHGYRTIEAQTGEQALEIAQDQMPDLVVMDIQLAGMSGIEALARLRSLPTVRHLPVLAFTASVMPQDRREIMAAGFDGFLAKPISLQEFIATVASLLGKSSAPQAP